MKSLVKTYLPLIGLAGFVVALDQITKAIVTANLAISEIWSPFTWLIPYARIVHWYNTGVAFGFFQNSNLLFSILASIVAVAIIYYYPQVSSKDVTLRLAMCLQLGGALGNLVDRIVRGHVVDFVSVGNFPVFNVADSSITIGVCILLYGFWIQEKDAHKKASANDASTLIDETPSNPEIHP